MKQNQKQLQRQQFIKNKGQLKGNNAFSNLLFLWIGPLLQYGNKICIDPSVIPQLSKNLKSQFIYQQLSKKFNSLPKSTFPGSRLFKSIISTFQSQILYCVFYFIILLISLNFTPFLTNSVIQFVQIRKQTSTQILKSLFFFFILFFILLIKGLSYTNLWYKLMVMAHNMTNAMILMIYKKILTYSLLCNKKYSYSDIINLIETDMQRIQYMGYNMMYAIYSPIRIIIGMIILYIYLGKIFFVVSIVIIFSFILTAYISRKAIQINSDLLQKRDIRMKSVGQIFKFIRFIKINNFQDLFKTKLQQKRRDQTKSKLKLNVVESVYNMINWMYYSVILSITFASFIVLGEQLTTAKAFTTIVLFRIIQYAIIQFPVTLTQSILAWQSIKRIQSFLNQNDIDQQNILKIQSDIIFRNEKGEEIAVKIDNCTFKWQINKIQVNEKSIKQEKTQYKQLNQDITSSFDQDSSQLKNKKLFLTALRNVTLQIKKLKLTMIIGDIGSGKSSLLYAIMNQMQKLNENSKIKIKGTFAFASQKAWIIPGTIKDNIILFSQFDAGKFNQVIYSTNLIDDLCSFPKAQLTQIGQKGINLSGGQKARISLARILYSDRDIFLLDDVLSAVDVNVGQFLMKQAILKYIVQKKKTIILLTHAMKYLRYADQIVVLQKGNVQFVGSYQKLKELQIFSNLDIICSEIQKKQNQIMENKKVQCKKLVTQKLNCLQSYFSLSGRQIQSNSEQKEDQENDGILLTDQSSKQVNKKKEINDKYSTDLEVDNKQMKNKQDLDFKKQLQQLQAPLLKSQSYNKVQELLIKQEKEEGSLKLSTFKAFIRLSGGYLLFILVLIFYMAWIAVLCLSNIIIQKWCEQLTIIDNHQTITNLICFITASIGSSILIFIAIVILTKQFEILSNQSHQKVMDSLLQAGLNQFFYRVTQGRIINRLARDIGMIDMSLINSLKFTFIVFFYTLGNLFMCIYASSYYVIVPLIVLVIFGIKVKRYFMKTLIECTRHQAIIYSNVIDHFINSMNGSCSIRAFCMEKYFFESQIKKVQQYKKIKMAKQALNSWFQIRMLFLTFLFNGPVILFCLLNRNYGSAVIGLVMSYIVNLSDQITQCMQWLAKLQNQMVSVQRINQFIEIKPQLYYLKGPQEVKQSFKMKNYIQRRSIKEAPNSIDFMNVSLNYLKNQQKILQNISFSIKKGQKIGIIGRTGSGKSTLFNSLVRVIEPNEGHILINGKDIAEYDVKELRKRMITIIDQESVVFDSSFRQNLNPDNEAEDKQIKQICEQSGLMRIIQSRGGLEANVSEDSLSVGQKQLISICRALLKKSPIILIDEATANIDEKNDQLIQSLFKRKNKNNTVLTIAHRLSTITSSDRILVLGQRGIKQFGTPEQLLSNEQSVYREMIEKNKKDWLE